MGEMELENKEQKKEREKNRRVIGQRVQQLRLGLELEKQSLGQFAQNIGLSESLLSRVESGKASLPLDVVELIAKTLGCRVDAIITGEAYPGEKNPLRSGIEFLQQAEGLGVDGIYQDRTSALGYLLPFAEKMRAGEINITGSSLRGLEQRSEHRFVSYLEKLGNNPQFKMKVIMTHPALGPKREHQENRPKGSIVREIFTGINWCIEVLNIPPENIRLSIVSPSSFSIFLIDGPEGRGIINPYPTMRQAFLSYTLAVRKVSAEKGAGEAVSIFETYLSANFREPWVDPNVTVALKEGLEDCKSCIAKGNEGSEELKPHQEMLELTLKKCTERKS